MYGGDTSDDTVLEIHSMRQRLESAMTIGRSAHDLKFYRTIHGLCGVCSSDSRPGDKIAICSENLAQGHFRLS